MQCCVPLCENTSENFSICGRITFHGYPSEARLRAAWLRALGEQDSQLPDSAVVCSQHFLHDDICETESGSRQLRTGAVPSTVLVCMMCLDTDSKMSPISQYNLEEAYEKLTGHPLWDGGNLKHTLCAQCAQQLRNFSRFREQSLRARSLMMELLEKHELITLQHIRLIQVANRKLRNNLVSTKLRPDPYDMYIVEYTDEDRQTDSKESVLGDANKTECIDDTQSIGEDMRGIKEEISDCVKEEFTIERLKYESSAFTCTVCCEEFPHEHAYSAHVRMQLHGDARPAAPPRHAAVTPLSVRLVTNAGNEARATEAVYTTQHGERALVSNSGASDNRAPDSDHRTNTDLKSCVVKLYDILKHPQNAKIKIEPQTLQTACDSLNAHAACADAQYRAASEEEVATTHNEPAASVLSETEPVCERAFTQKNNLATHMKSHTDEKPYSCKICSDKFVSKCKLVRHMRTHSDEKPFSCKICSFKCTDSSSLVKHKRTHTGEKPYSCKNCSYRCTNSCSLVIHMRTHTGEKPYSCKICSYRYTNSSNLVIHMRTHTGEKPYSCEICSNKFVSKHNLDRHMSTHTGKKPYSCKLCEHKFTQKSHLTDHLRTHTGEKPYPCEICSDKFVSKYNVVRHMRTHTGEKPYSCKICSYKCTETSNLAKHTRRHTGEKPYSCGICSYKCTIKSNLVKHMRFHPVHTEQPSI